MNFTKLSKNHNCKNNPKDFEKSRENPKTNHFMKVYKILKKSEHVLQVFSLYLSKHCFREKYYQIG